MAGGKQSDGRKDGGLEAPIRRVRVTWSRQLSATVKASRASTKAIRAAARAALDAELAAEFAPERRPSLALLGLAKRLPTRPERLAFLVGAGVLVDVAERFATLDAERGRAISAGMRATAERREAEMAALREQLAAAERAYLADDTLETRRAWLDAKRAVRRGRVA